MNVKQKSIVDRVPDGLLTLAVAALLLASIAPIVSAGWDCRKPVTINNLGDALSDYQVLITLNSSNFDYSKTNPDGSDIGFVDEDNTIALNYWIEEWNAAGDSRIWVAVPSVDGSGSTMTYMYYGNPGASDASDGDATFEFFDDFEGTQLDTNKWNFSGCGSYTVSESYIVLDAKSSTSGNRILSQSDITGNYVIETTGYVIVGYQLNQYRPTVYWKTLPDFSRRYMWDTWGSSIDSWVMTKRNASGYFTLGSVSGADISLLDSYSGKFEIQLIVDGNTYTGKETLRNKVKTATDSELTGHRIGLGAPKVKTKYDWILVRQYTSPEPITTVGTEESNPPKPPIPTYILDTDTDDDGVPDVWDVDNNTQSGYWTDPQGNGRRWGDMNGDDKLTSADALMILQAAAEAIGL